MEMVMHNTRAARLHLKFFGSTLPWGCSPLAGSITEETRKGHVAMRVEGQWALLAAWIILDISYLPFLETGLVAMQRHSLVTL